MPLQIEPEVQGTHFAAVRAGAPSHWGEHRFHHSRLGTVPGKAFLRGPLGLTSAEISVNALAPGAAMSFLHTHKQNEEIYIFLAGTGEFQVDGKVFPIQAGSMVRVDPEGRRCWRNTGSEPLLFMVIQAKAGSLAQATTEDGAVPPEAPVWG